MVDELEKMVHDDLDFDELTAKQVRDHLDYFGPEYFENEVIDQWTERIGRLIEALPLLLDLIYERNIPKLLADVDPAAIDPVEVILSDWLGGENETAFGNLLIVLNK